MQCTRDSLADPESFWLPIANELITWKEPPKRALLVKENKWQWLPGGVFNTCYNALDRHDPNSIALRYDSPVTNFKQSFTYGELLKKVKLLSNVLIEHGVEKGDVVLMYMPMIPAAVESMLACSRIGAISCVVFGGFAAAEVAKRIDDSRPKVIITASCGVEPNKVIPYLPIIEEAISISGQHSIKVIVKQREIRKSRITNQIIDYDDACQIMETKKVECECVDTKSSDPLYLLYTSGTTGKPKGIVRDCGGHALMKLYIIKYMFGLRKGETIFCSSDIGWTVGHSFTVLGPLLAGLTTVLYEGKPIGTPNAGSFWRICKEYNARILFTAPTALRAIKQEDPSGRFIQKYSPTCLKAIFLAGERSEPELVRVFQPILQRYGDNKAMIIDNYWTTETGSPNTGILLEEGHSIKIGSAGMPLPGMDIIIVNDEGIKVPTGETGTIAIRPPLAPAAFREIWRQPGGMEEKYFKRFRGRLYDTGDTGYIDANGYVFVMARTDDIINVAAHRLSTGQIEQVLTNHPLVSQAVVVALPDSFKGHMPLAFIVPTTSKERIDYFTELNNAVRKSIGPIASLAGVIVTSPKGIPKTRSGKSLRRVLRELAENGQRGRLDDPISIPATIEDPESIAIARDAIRHHVVGRCKL